MYHRLFGMLKCYNHKTRFKCHLIQSLFHSPARTASPILQIWIEFYAFIKTFLFISIYSTDIYHLWGSKHIRKVKVQILEQIKFTSEGTVICVTIITFKFIHSRIY